MALLLSTGQKTKILQAISGFCSVFRDRLGFFRAPFYMFSTRESMLNVFEGSADLKSIPRRPRAGEHVPGLRPRLCPEARELAHRAHPAPGAARAWLLGRLRAVVRGAVDWRQLRSVKSSTA